MSERKYQDEEWLREKYWEENMSQNDIADKVSVDRRTVGKWMRRKGIERRDNGEAVSVAQQDCKGLHRDEGWLRDKYVGTDRNIPNVSDICGCSRETVRLWLEKYGIERSEPWEGKEVDCSGKHRSKKWIEEKYVETDRSSVEVAEGCGCTSVTILEWVDKFGFERKDWNKIILSCSRKHESKDWIIRKYIDEDMSIESVADVCGCSSSVIKRKMDEFGIDRKKQYSCSGNHREYDWLVEKYHEEGLLVEDMGELCGCHQATVSAWMDKHGIETDNGTFSSGEDHWNYIDGSSTGDKLDFRNSDEWDEFSSEKKEEANWKCEYCGSEGYLHTHHVYPVSMGGDKWDNDFIVLCRECHIGDYGLWHPPQLEEYICPDE